MFNDHAQAAFIAISENIRSSSGCGTWLRIIHNTCMYMHIRNCLHIYK